MVPRSRGRSSQHYRCLWTEFLSHAGTLYNTDSTLPILSMTLRPFLLMTHSLLGITVATISQRRSSCMPGVIMIPATTPARHSSSKGNHQLTHMIYSSLPPMAGLSIFGALTWQVSTRLLRNTRQSRTSRLISEITRFQETAPLRHPIRPLGALRDHLIRTHTLRSI